MQFDEEPAICTCLKAEPREFYLSTPVMCSRPQDISFRYAKTLLQNHPDPVYSSLLGSALINNNLVVLDKYPIIMRKDHKLMKGKVKLLAGGGAGIEPADSLYIGKGMLTAAVVGEIFTSPTVNEILVAIRELSVNNPDGVLLLVKNYIGEKLNFGLALERAVKEDILVKMLVIGDNISDSPTRKLGRKGLAGCVLVYKIAGEMAEQGKTVEEIIEECRERVFTDLATVNVTLSLCGGPVCGSLIQNLEPNEIAWGAGIYGNYGLKKQKPESLKAIVAEVLVNLTTFLKINFNLETQVVVLINNSGGTSKFEESLLAIEVHNQLKDLGVKIALLYSGTFISSFSTQGFSITLLKIDNEDALHYLTAPTTAPAWPKHSPSEDERTEPTFLTVAPQCKHELLNKAKFEGQIFGPSISEKATAALKLITVFAAEAIISCERQLNIIDSEVGDGDTGTMLKKAAEAIKKRVLSGELKLSVPGRFLTELSDICCSVVGGLSGAFYSIFFNGVATPFLTAEEISVELCCKAFRSGVRAIKHYGKAEIGDRTVLDALCPAVDSFESAIAEGKKLTDAMNLAAQTCEFKAEDTKRLKPSMEQHLDSRQALLYADAGAHAATIWLRAITFAPDEPCPRPQILLWKFLTKEEAQYVLADEVSFEDIIAFLERKLKPEQTLLVILLLDTLKFCRKKYDKNLRKTSALVSTVYYTHLFFTSSKWRTAPETYFYFRENILCQSVESPPTSAEIFDPEEAKEALFFFFENYLRNLPLVRLLHLPHYKLQLKLKEENQKSTVDFL